MLSARLSPDGHTITFSSFSDGTLQIFVMLAAGGDPLQLTKDEGDKYAESFSADGTEIYYSRSLGRDEAWAVPTLGGMPHRVASGWSVAPAPDDSGLFFIKSDPPAVFRVGKSGASEEEVFRIEKGVAKPESLLPFPNNTDLLVVAELADGSGARFYKVNVRTRSSTDLGIVAGLASWPAWLDPGSTVLFSRTLNNRTNVWTYNLNDRSFTQITAGPGPDLFPMRDPGGKGIYYVSGKWSGLLTMYQAKTRTTSDIVADAVLQPAISPDGKRVMYVRYLEADRSELWVSELDGSSRLKLASGRKLGTLDWSNDNLHVAFTDGTHLYIVGVDGRDLNEINGTEGRIVSGAWSMDAARLFISAQPSSSPIWMANVDGSHTEKLLDRGFPVAALSGDSKHLIGFITVGPDVGIYQMTLADKRRVPLLPGVVTFQVRFSADYKSFIYAVAGRSEVIFYRQGWHDGALVGKPQIATKVPFAFPFAFDGNAFDFSRDLSKIVYVRPGGQHDLYFLSQ